MNIPNYPDHSFLLNYIVRKTLPKTVHVNLTRAIIESLSTQDQKDLLKTCLHAKNIKKVKNKVKATLPFFSGDVVREAFKELFILNYCVKKDYDGLNFLKDFFSTKEVEKLIHQIDTDFKTTYAYAKTLIDILEPKSNVYKGSHNQPSPFFTALKNIIYKFLSTFTLLNLGRPPKTFFEQKYMCELFQYFFAIPSVVFGALMFFLPAMHALIITGGVLAVLIIIAIIASALKKNVEIPGFTNYSRLFKEGKIEEQIGREKEIEEIGNLLSYNSKHYNIAPTITGEPGVGKNTLVKQLVAMIENKDERVRHLWNKQVFVANAEEFKESSPNFNPLSPLDLALQATQGRENKVIWVLDEIHEAFSTKEGMGKKLKDLIDTKPDSLPYVITITTPNKYEEIFKADSSLDGRRFEEKKLANTDQATTIAILKNQCLENKIGYEEKGLEKLYELSNKVSELQPRTAVGLLAKIESHICKKSFGEEESLKKQQLMQEKQKLIDTNRVNYSNPLFFSSPDGSKLAKRIEELNHQINLTEQERMKKSHYSSHYFTLFEKVKNLQETTLSLAKKIVSRKNNKKEEVQFLLSQYFLLPALNETLNLLQWNLGLKITPAIVEEIFQKHYPN
ncbi:MAG: hypothetical protein BGO10_09400 [Chlamydia sp. 32-24]|nr:MAG: hypothetical protein BGO10_09400 [Chlamydia sp. 32-24]